MRWPLAFGCFAYFNDLDLGAHALAFGPPFAYLNDLDLSVHALVFTGSLPIFTTCSSAFKHWPLANFAF